MDDSLKALCPLDGRYKQRTQHLADYGSEQALIQSRLRIEAQWVLHLSQHPQTHLLFPLSSVACTALEQVLNKKDILLPLVQRAKQLEIQTNHDVKAAEYALREHLQSCNATSQDQAYLHFACTSEDINNIAYTLMWQDLRSQCVLPAMQALEQTLAAHIQTSSDIPLLARTHGQAASPTTMGKELAVFYTRLQRQKKRFLTVRLLAKCNGSVGNYNAHQAVYPQVDWPLVCQDFIEKKFGLSWNSHTTQIENHDSIVELCDALRGYNSVVLNLCRDLWAYISVGYFNQKVEEQTVGSSTMPHKVNPIQFENAEGNIGLANSLLHHFADKLPVSRWQRDLSDSTVLRNIAMAFGYSVLAHESCEKGLQNLSISAQSMAQDLDHAWQVLTEAVQTALRAQGIANGYERLKTFCHGQQLTREQYQAFVTAQPELPQNVKQALLELTPQTYIGLSPQLAQAALMVVGDSRHDHNT